MLVAFRTSRAFGESGSSVREFRGGGEKYSYQGSWDGSGSTQFGSTVVFGSMVVFASTAVLPSLAVFVLVVSALGAVTVS